jgi:hypothetical protein
MNHTQSGSCSSHYIESTNSVSGYRTTAAVETIGHGGAAKTGVLYAFHCVMCGVVELNIFEEIAQVTCIYNLKLITLVISHFTMTNRIVGNLVMIVHGKELTWIP